VIAELGDLAQYWITLNEPWCSAFLGYGSGAHAPGRTNTRDAVAAGHHLCLAHGLALAELRRSNSRLRVGVSNLVVDVQARSTSPEDVAAADRLDAADNRFFLDPIYRGAYSPGVHAIYDVFGLRDVIAPGDLEIVSQPTDFVGVNHYQRVIAWADDSAGHLKLGESPAEPATTSFGWSVIPGSLTNVLQRVSKDYTALPLYITESGASYHDYVDPEGRVLDPERVDYLSRYIDAVAEALAGGTDVAGYFAWSFLDNYEWAEGYSKRFGLVYVDYRTQARIPKLSARWYSQLIRRHGDKR
jgi:beta-glucosidase